MEQGIITKSWLQYFTAEVLVINKVLTYVKVSIRKSLVIFSDNSMSVLHAIENQESKNPLVNRVRKKFIETTLTLNTQGFTFQWAKHIWTKHTYTVVNWHVIVVIADVTKCTRNGKTPRPYYDK